jgi:hypothetical protein
VGCVAKKSVFPLRAGHELFFDSDQLLLEAAAEAVRRSIKNCQYVNFPTLDHYPIIWVSRLGQRGKYATLLRKG